MARETLVKAGTSVIRDQTQLIRIHSQIAGIHARAGRTSQALASREPALAVATRLVDAHLGDLGIQAELAGAYLNIADLLTTTGTPSEALPWHDKALAIQRKMVEAELSDSRYQPCRRHQAPRDHAPEVRPARRGGLGLPRGDRPTRRAGEPDIRRHLRPRLLRNRSSPASPPMPAPVSRPHDGQAEADQAMKSLRRAIAAGWKDRAHMRADTDFDPLRSRPDFRELMMDLTMPTDPFAHGR